MDTRRFFPRRIFLALTGMVCIPGVAATLTPAADAFVEDGIDGPRDGSPDLVVENGIVQILDTAPQEDRGIIEFSLAGLSSPISNARLTLPVFTSMGPFPFGIDVFAYSGDGQVTLEDWTGGAFLESFTYRGRHVIRLNVTSAVEAALEAQQQFIGFRFEFSGQSPIPSNGPFLALNTLEFPPAATLRVSGRGAGGSLTGVAPEQVICRNLTTGQTVTIEAGGDSWDCVEEGLDVRPGDHVSQTTIESAE